MELLDRLSNAWKLAGRLDLLHGVLSSVESFDGVLTRLYGLERRMPPIGILEALASRLEGLDKMLTKVEASSPAITPAVAAASPQTQVSIDALREWERLKLLSQFVHLFGKGKEIETEWQRIQQDEHDFQFAFNSSPTEENQSKYLYKKGIADGVKWCLKNFS